MKVTLPEDISEITLLQFQNFIKLQEREDLTPLEHTKRLASIFTGISYNDLNGVSLRDLGDVRAQVERALNKEAKFKAKFILGGDPYGFITNLDQITAGEYIDLSEYDTGAADMHKLMAVLFRPVTKSDAVGNYEIEPYNGTGERAELFKQLPMNIVDGAMVFFWLLAKELKQAIPNYTAQGIAKAKARTAISRNGNGTRPFTD